MDSEIKPFDPDHDYVDQFLTNAESNTRDVANLKRFATKPASLLMCIGWSSSFAYAGGRDAWHWAFVLIPVVLPWVIVCYSARLGASRIQDDTVQRLARELYEVVGERRSYKTKMGNNDEADRLIDLCEHQRQLERIIREKLLG